MIDMVFELFGGLSPTKRSIEALTMRVAPVIRQSVPINDVPLNQTTENITVDIGPTGGDANAIYAARGTPYLDFMTTTQVTANIARLSLYGGSGYINYDNNPAGLAVLGRPSYNTGWWVGGGGWEFATDAITLTISYVATTIGGSVAVLVDGKILQGADIGGLFSDAVVFPQNNQTRYITLTFPSRKNRLITFLPTSGLLRGIHIDAGSNIWVPRFRRPKMLILGDSFTARVAASGETASTSTLRMLASMSGRILGYNTVNIGEGGTGFLNNGGGSPKGTYRQYLQYLIDSTSQDFNDGRGPQAVHTNQEYDLIWFFASGNDGSAYISNPDAYEAEITTALNLAISRWPDAKIIVSTIYEGFNSVSNATGMSASIANVVSALNNANISIISVNSANIPAGDIPLFSGSGSVAAPAGDGNADIYFSSIAQGSSDRHPNTLGCEYAGRYFADRIASLL